MYCIIIQQDNDVDVRFCANNAVSEANCLGAHLMQDHVSYPSLFPSPELTVSITSQKKSISQDNSVLSPSSSSSSASKQDQLFGRGQTRDSSKSLTGSISTVEGRSIEGLATSLSIALTWKVLSDAKKRTPSSLESCDILTKWLDACPLPEETEAQSIGKVFYRIRHSFHHFFIPAS